VLHIQLLGLKLYKSCYDKGMFKYQNEINSENAEIKPVKKRFDDS